MSAVVGRPDVMDLFPAGSMTSTHTGNPVCCSAVLASLDIIQNEHLVDNARVMGGLLQRTLQGMKARYPQIGEVFGKGLVAGVACIEPGTKNPDGELAWEVVRRSIEKGVLMFSPVGPAGCTVKIAPPLMIPEAALRESLAAFEEAFREAVGARAAVA